MNLIYVLLTNNKLYLFVSSMLTVGDCQCVCVYACVCVCVYVCVCVWVSVCVC